MAAYHLTREQLLLDLHQAYHDARRHKRNKPYQLHFERCSEANLERLCDELWHRTYRPGPSTCFIITDPKRREVFAAQFRDRIVHHLYYNYVHEMLERTFIADSYSCIKHRGTHYGIARLERHIRRESQNYSVPCYVLKMDISGYFMHIDRNRLHNVILRQLRSMAHHKLEKRSCEHWLDRVDMDFVEWLTGVIIMQDPVSNCYRRGNLLHWHELPRSKSLFYSPEGCGLPIGNLTSQLFSNVYLNELDQFAKRQLLCRHYGRYVDDFYVVSADRLWLCSLQQPLTLFLRNSLGLEVNQGKTCVADVRKGVGFLGAYLKPCRRYVNNTTIRRLKRKTPTLKQCDNRDKMCSRFNSMLGLLSHYKSYNLRIKILFPLMNVYLYGYYQKGMCKFVMYPPLYLQSTQML